MAYTPRESGSPSPAPCPLPDEQPAPTVERRGCLFALAQLPLIIFLGFVSTLLLLAAVHDLFLL